MSVRHQTQNHSNQHGVGSITVYWALLGCFLRTNFLFTWLRCSLGRFVMVITSVLFYQIWEFVPKKSKIFVHLFRDHTCTPTPLPHFIMWTPLYFVSALWLYLVWHFARKDLLTDRKKNMRLLFDMWRCLETWWCFMADE